MRLTHWNGIAFSTALAPKWDSIESQGPALDPIAYSRVGAPPVIAGIETGPQVITVTFTAAAGAGNIENALALALALINPDRPTAGTLRGAMVDGTVVESTAVPGSYRYDAVNRLLVDFHLTSGWRAQTASTLLTATTYSANGSFSNLNTGYRDVLPTITGYWPSGGSQRSSKTSTYGYEQKLSYTITNNGAEPIINEPWQIGPIRVAGGSPFLGTTLPSGNDVRIFCEGVEWPRSLIGFDSANGGYGFIWLVIPVLAPGQSITLDVVMNNASAGSPPTLSFSSTPAAPAIDITGEFFVSSASTATTLSKGSATWSTDQWAGGTVMTGSAGTGSGQMRRVTSNTTSQLTISRAWGTNPVTQDSTVIKSGLMGDGGTASGVASLVLTDSSQSWSTNEWIGATVSIITGTGAGTTGTVVSNTSTALTVASWSSTAPAAASTYNVYRKNGVWLYDMRTVAGAQAGLWSLNRTASSPSQVNFDSPASWYRFTLQRSRDTYSQPRFFKSGSTYWANMQLRRSRRGKVGNQTEVGVADSIGVSCPFGIIGTRFGYTIRNAKKQGSSPAAGLAEFKSSCQESGGEVWASFLSDTTVYSGLTNVSEAWYDLTGFGYPIRVANSLVPNGSDEVPDSDNNEAEVRSYGNYVKLAVNPNNVIAETNPIFPAFPAVANCYDTYLIVRTGGAGSIRPYQRIVIGGSGHRLFLFNDTERVVVDCETHRAYITDNLGAFQRNIPWAVQAQDVVDDADGSAVTLVAPRWLPIPPSALDSANIYFSDPSGAGWGNFRLALAGKFGYLV